MIASVAGDWPRSNYSRPRLPVRYAHLMVAMKDRQMPVESQLRRRKSLQWRRNGSGCVVRLSADRLSTWQTGIGRKKRSEMERYFSMPKCVSLVGERSLQISRVTAEELSVPSMTMFSDWRCYSGRIEPKTGSVWMGESLRAAFTTYRRQPETGRRSVARQRSAWRRSSGIIKPCHNGGGGRRKFL